MTEEVQEQQESKQTKTIDDDGFEQVQDKRRRR
jgi:hypothetical protein